MKHGLLQGTVFTSFTQFVTIISNYLIHIGLVHFLGPEIYGTFGVILSLIFITKTVFMTGLHRSVSKYVSESDNNPQSVFKSGMKLQIVLIILVILIFVFFSGQIASIFNDPGLKNLIIFSAIVYLPFGVYNLTAYGLLNGLRLFHLQAGYEALHSILRIGIAFLLVYCGLGIRGAIISFAIAPLILLGFMWLSVKKYLSPKIKPIIKPISAPFKGINLLNFSLQLSGFYVIMALMMELGLLSVKSILGSDLFTGYYTSASTLGKIIISISTALPLTILPSISSAYSKKDFALVRKYITQSLRYSLLIFLPLTVLISTNAGPILNLFYPAEFMAAAQPLSILIFGFMLLTFLMMTASYLFGAGHNLWPAIISLGALIILVILNLKLIPMNSSYGGLNGAALSTTLASLIGLAAMLAYAYKKFKILMPLSSFLKITAASSIIYFLGHYWSFSGWLFLISALLLFILYFLVLIIFKELKKEDWELVKSFRGRNK